MEPNLPMYSNHPLGECQEAGGGQGGKQCSLGLGNHGPEPSKVLRRVALGSGAVIERSAQYAQRGLRSGITKDCAQGIDFSMTHRIRRVLIPGHRNMKERGNCIGFVTSFTSTSRKRSPQNAVLQVLDAERMPARPARADGRSKQAWARDASG